MARAYYTEYVNHCMKFYTRHPKPKTDNLIEVSNWQACELALADFSSEEKEILIFVYQERDTIPDNVYNISKKKGINQNKVWNLIIKLEQKIAKIRGLI
ncbi:hypothetical protein [Criibacterium bergeronii]|uniref:Sigma-70 family RNA polymerase sigma factor n=1 Tax=Criibacterium bergeronii TaxID=1871336 RepID=A0A1C0AG72_9FIRM|nr:hypothetical protein [Criibacterium bergeronii]RDY21415.1 hypothetical protein BBG48_004665 [Criibacterium bergeronii]